VIVDEAERIEAFVGELDELIDEGLVILDDVEVYRYVGRTAPGDREGEQEGGR
jgi:PII-like signaling protein